MRKYLFAFLLMLITVPVLSQTKSGLALTPPMGWNSWNKFQCNVSEKLIREMADAMGASGMKDAGYQYIVIDDCWQVARDSTGKIVADPVRFSSGMKALADYVHSKGLKFGLYSDAGTATCQKRPGSKGFEEKDARQYASWEVDYLKYDWCNTKGQDARESYTTMSKALQNSGRPIVFSVCEWGSNQPWLWAPAIANLWRTTDDIQDCWNCTQDWGGMGWPTILDKQVGLEKYAGPGHWNDPDMLEVGNGGMTGTEYQAHFSLWCILAAPLMAGNDLRSMTAEIKNILTNKEVIALDQDPLGIQGSKIRDDGDFEVWLKPLQGGDVGVCFLNRSAAPKDFRIEWKDLSINGKFKIKDLWNKKSVEDLSATFSSKVDSHGVILLRLMKEK